jgi:hypothetical protein
MGREAASRAGSESLSACLAGGGDLIMPFSRMPAQDKHEDVDVVCDNAAATSSRVNRRWVKHN